MQFVGKNFFSRRYVGFNFNFILRSKKRDKKLKKNYSNVHLIIF